MKKNLLFSLVSAALLAGCASFPEGYGQPLQIPDLQAELADAWSSRQAVTYIPSNAGVVQRKAEPLPEEVAGQKVALDLAMDATLSLHELAAVLRARGIKVVSRLGDETRNLTVDFMSYKGTLGELMESLAQLHNIDVSYRNGTVFLQDMGRYEVSFPPHVALMDAVVKSLEGAGAVSPRADAREGRIHYMARPDDASYVEQSLQRIAKNSAMVTLQVAVIDVRLTRDIGLGFDWSKLSVGTGNGEKYANYAASLTAPAAATVTSGTSGGASGATSAPAAAVRGEVLSFAGGDGVSYTFADNVFNLSAALKALSKFGDARTDQNVVLGTLSGMPVKISSGTEIPYVKSIGSTNSSGGATPGSTRTETVDSGLSLEVTPQFDHKNMSVVTEVKVDMSTLVAMRKLSAGNNLGTLTQPELQKLEFENIARLGAGETVVVGGITYDQLSNNYTSFPGMEQAKVGSKSEIVNRHAIYIVIRPTVVVFGEDPRVARAQPVTLPARLEAAPGQGEAK